MDQKHARQLPASADEASPCLLFLGAADEVLAQVREFARETENQVRTILEANAHSKLNEINPVTPLSAKL